MLCQSPLMFRRVKFKSDYQRRGFDFNVWVERYFDRSKNIYEKTKTNITHVSILQILDNK